MNSTFPAYNVISVVLFVKFYLKTKRFSYFIYNKGYRSKIKKPHISIIEK